MTRRGSDAEGVRGDSLPDGRGVQYGGVSESELVSGSGTDPSSPYASLRGECGSGSGYVSSVFPSVSSCLPGANLVEVA